MIVENASSSFPLRPEKSLPEDMQYLDASQPYWRLTIRTPSWRPPTDVFETEDALVVRVEIAGMDEDDFSIELDERFLYIRGVRSDTSERRAYHQMEIRFGEFGCEVELPMPVIASKVEATYHNGFLRVTLPKTRSRQIPIQE